MKTYSGNIKPGRDIIFVFGSNPEGRHGAGSAKVAREYFGAIYGQGEGLQGNSYAIPTKDLRVTENRGYRSISEEQIVEGIKRMYKCAEEHPDKMFMVAYRNQPNERSLCGYTGAELQKCFRDACDGNYPDNIYFSEEWTNGGIL